MVIITRLIFPHPSFVEIRSVTPHLREQPPRGSWEIARLRPSRARRRSLCAGRRPGRCSHRASGISYRSRGVGQHRRRRRHGSSRSRGLGRRAEEGVGRRLGGPAQRARPVRRNLDGVGVIDARASPRVGVHGFAVGAHVQEERIVAAGAEAVRIAGHRTIPATQSTACAPSSDLVRRSHGRVDQVGWVQGSR
jgi:hypothetical protein